MNEEAERVRGYQFPGPGSMPARTAPRPTGTLEAILAGVQATPPEARLVEDLDRIEQALARLERAMREALEDDAR